MSQLISYTLNDGVATLTLNNGKVNALSQAVLAALDAGLERRAAGADVGGVQLDRGDPVVVGPRVAARGEVDVDEQEAGLDPGHEQRLLAERAQTVRGAGLDDGVEHGAVQRQRLRRAVRFGGGQLEARAQDQRPDF